MTIQGHMPSTSLPRSGPLRVAASPASDWVAVAESPSGLLVLARGHGRALPMAAALPGVFESAIATSFADRSEEGLPAAVAAVVRLFRAAHQDLRQSGGGHGDGLEVLVCMIVQGRVFVVQAGAAVRCLRWRQRRWELLAPIGERARPALGAEARALIEVVSEPLHEGDLVLALVPADAGPIESAARSAIAAWAERPYETMPRVPGDLAWVALVKGEIGMRDVGIERPELGRVPASVPALSGIPAAPSAALPGPPAGSLAAELDRIPLIELEDSDLEGAPVEGAAVEGAAAKGAAASGGDAERARPAPFRAPGAIQVRAGAGKSPQATSRSKLSRWRARGVVILPALVVGMVLVLAKDEIGKRLPASIPWPGQRVQEGKSGGAPPPPATSAGLGAPAGIGAAIPFGPDSAATGAPSPAGAAGGVSSPPGFGAVSAHTEPATPNIEVYLDDRAVGRAPVVLDRVSPGRHRVRYRGPENYHWEEEVMVREGELARAVAPIDRGEELAFVTVQSSTLSEEGFEEEEGNEVVVDGKLRGKTPLELDLAPGVHAIAVKRNGSPPIIRVVELRRSDHINLDVRVDEPPRFTIEHTPPAGGEAGGTLLLTATCDGLESSPTTKLYMHYAIDESWDRLPMGEVPGAFGTYVIGLPVGAERAGKKLRYYFSIPLGSGEQPIYSSIFSTPIR